MISTFLPKLLPVEYNLQQLETFLKQRSLYFLRRNNHSVMVFAPYHLLFLP